MQNRVTKERIEICTNKLIYELLGFQISKKEIITGRVEGCVDLPLFRIRFRFQTPQDIRDDFGYDIILIPDIEEINFDKIFWPLVRKGYMNYIRNRVAPSVFGMVLERADLWKKILNVAIDEAQGNPYKVQYCKSLLKKPLREILSLNAATFDWIV